MIMAKKDKAPLKYRLLEGVLKLWAKLPLRMLYPVSTVASRVLRDVVKYRRDVVVGNIRRAFPEVSEEEVNLWARQFYGHLTDVFIEAVKLLGISDKQVDRRVKVFDAEIVDRAIESGHSVVLFLGHYGNWEWVPSIVRHFKSDVDTLQIYRPVRNKIFDRLMLKIRSRFGSESVPMANTFKRMAQIEKSGRHCVVGFISDQRPMNHHTGSWTEFLGIDTDFITGAEIIGNRLKCKYIYLDVEPVARGRYNLTFKKVEPINDGKDFPYTRSYLSLLEQTIRRNPAYWLWSHKRFSHSRPERDV